MTATHATTLSPAAAILYRRGRGGRLLGAAVAAGAVAAGAAGGTAARAIVYSAIVWSRTASSDGLNPTDRDAAARAQSAGRAGAILFAGL
jgi:hypothetical protein